MFGSAALFASNFRPANYPDIRLFSRRRFSGTSKAGVTWYRLQIGGDETFRNIFYDRRVFGGRYTVSNLPPGYYYWRIAPADDQLGAFSRPVRFFVSGGVVTPVFISREYPDQTAAFDAGPTPLIRRSLGEFNYVGG